ncbi:hypothetical protein T12_5051, partial [Trichinella patagoniensis]
LAYKMEKKALLKKRSADETKPIPAIYDDSAASAEPSTSGQFPVFKRVRAAMCKHRAKRFPRLPEHRHDLPDMNMMTTGTLAALFQYFRQETNNHLEGWHNRLNRKAGKCHNGFYELLQLLIAEQGVMDTLIQQVLSGNVAVGDLRRVNRVYAQKQRQVAQYTGEYNNGTRTLEQFLAALMYITPEPI